MTSPSDFDRTTARKKYLPVYDALYKAYPLHQDYAGGFNAFLTLLSEGEDPQLLIEKATSYAHNVEDVKYAPHLKTWLLGRRFEDEDIFTDQLVHKREWFKGCYLKGDAQAVQNKYGFIYTHPPVPEDCEDPGAWHLDQRKLWIGMVARHILHGGPVPE